LILVRGDLLERSLAVIRACRTAQGQQRFVSGDFVVFDGIIAKVFLRISSSAAACAIAAILPMKDWAVFLRDDVLSSNLARHSSSLFICPTVSARCDFTFVWIGQPFGLPFHHSRAWVSIACALRRPETKINRLHFLFSLEVCRVRFSLHGSGARAWLFEGTFTPALLFALHPIDVVTCLRHVHAHQFA
jgi:hypothetical protein